MSEELKPCPFCGNDGIDIGDSKGSIFMYCNTCGAGGGFVYDGYGKEKAIESWNTRPNDAKVDKEQLKSIIKSTLIEYEDDLSDGFDYYSPTGVERFTLELANAIIEACKQCSI